jgi:hypothetical protein
LRNPAQVRLAQDHDMIQTFAPDRSDQSIGKAILSRRGWCSRLVPDAHGAQPKRHDITVDAITVTDQVLWILMPRECLRYCKNLQDRRKPAIQLDKEPAIIVREPDSAVHLTPQNDKLMAERGILGFKPALRLEWRRQNGEYKK